jgi:uncharacterized protein (TIGR02594 family)
MENEINKATIEIEIAQNSLDTAREVLEKLRREAELKRNSKYISLNEKILQILSEEIGTKEIPGNGSNPEIELYHSYASEDNDEPLHDGIPWCSSFLCYLVEVAGQKSVNSRAARAWLNYGIKTLSPVPGDIVVFWRGSRSSWMGHCGVYIAETPTHVLTGGGNQADEVNLTWYSKNKVLDYRAHGTDAVSIKDVERLSEIAKKLQRGESIKVGGAVQ